MARQIMEGAVAPNDGCALIAEICHRNNHPRELGEFALLAEEQHGHEHLGFTPQTVAPLILEECRRLLGSA